MREGARSSPPERWSFRFPERSKMRDCMNFFFFFFFQHVRSTNFTLPYSLGDMQEARACGVLPKRSVSGTCEIDEIFSFFLWHARSCLAWIHSERGKQVRYERSPSIRRKRSRSRDARLTRFFFFSFCLKNLLHTPDLILTFSAE